MDNQPLNLVNQYHVAMLENALKTMHYELYTLLQGDNQDACITEILQITNKNTLVCATYFLLLKSPIQLEFIKHLVHILKGPGILSDAEQFALTSICYQCIISSIEDTVILDLVILLRINNIEGFLQISQQIHGYLRSCGNVKVPALFNELYLKGHFELLVQHEMIYKEDFIWTLPSTDGIQLPDIKHPYKGILETSIYLRNYSEELQCPICPEILNLMYCDKLESIFRRILSEKEKFKKCFDLFKYCLIKINAFNVLMIEELDSASLDQIKQQFIESVFHCEELSAEQLKIYKLLKIDDLKIKCKIYKQYSYLFDENTLEDYQDECLLRLLIEGFEKIEKKSEIISALLKSKQTINIRVVTLLHIKDVEIDLQFDRIGHNAELNQIQNFKPFSQFNELEYSQEYQYLCECLKLTGIAIFSMRNLNIDQLQNKGLDQKMKLCFNKGLHDQQVIYILNLLLSISSGYSFEEEQFYDENKEYIQIENLPQNLKDIKIVVPYFLEQMIILIFETNVSQSIRIYYINYLMKIITNLENVLILEQSQFIDKLILYLRIETHLQGQIIEILTHSMKIKFSLSNLQAITQFMSPYLSIILIPVITDPLRKDKYKRIAQLLGVSKKAIQCSSQHQYEEYQSQNEELFYNNLNLLLDCLGKVVHFQNDQYYYFIGRESQILVQGKIIFEMPTPQFSILMHIKCDKYPSCILHFANSEQELAIFIEYHQEFPVIKFSYKKNQITKIAKFLMLNDAFLVINYKGKFSININGNEILPLIHESFEGFQMNVWSQISIGSTLEGEYSLRGEIKFLFILDQLSNSEDLHYLYQQKSLRNGNVFSQLLKMQIKARIVANLNTSYFREHKKGSSSNLLIQSLESDWQEMSDKRDTYFIIRSNKKKQSTIAKFMDKIFTNRKSQSLNNQTVLEPDKILIEYRNVLFQECTTLLDIIKNYGNLDILFFPLHLLHNCDQTICKLLNLLTTIIDKYGDDNQIQNYLRSDGENKGLDVLGYLLTVYIKNNGCSIELASQILNFYLKLIRPQCQLMQIIRYDAFSIFYTFEYWQYCDYPILQLLYGKLLEQLDKDIEFFNYFKSNHFIDQLFYVLSIQINEFDPKKGELKTYVSVRQYIMKSIIHIMYSPFLEIVHGSPFPEQVILKDKQPNDKLFDLKDEILSLLNHITLGSAHDFLKLLNFCLKKPQLTLILELMNEEKKKINLAKEGNGKLIDVMQSQFALSLRQDQDEQNNIVNKIYITIYGLMTELIIKQQQKQQEETIFEMFMGLLTDTLVKVQILVINFESAYMEQKDSKQLQQILKQKEEQIIRQLLLNISTLFDPSLQFGQKTYQRIINLATPIFKKNLVMEKEILDFFLPRFINMNLPSKEIVIDFFLQCSQQQQFMFTLCLHDQILEFIKALIITVDENNNKLAKTIKDKGQTLTNYIVLHHIENVKFSARKILRYFHYVNSFQLQNHMFMSVILTILILQNTHTKSLPALIDLFMLLPSALKMYPDMILSEPELFVKLFSEYLTYIEKQQLMSYFPDTEYVGYYLYDSKELPKKLCLEYESKNFQCNGGVLGTVIYILFHALELLINQKEGKPLLLIWKKIIIGFGQIEGKVRNEAQILIENQEIPEIQIKQRKIKLKQQKLSIMQKFKSKVLGQYEQTQYDKYSSDIHLMFLLKIQMMTHQHGNFLYELYTIIKFKPENYLNFAYIYNHLDKLKENEFEYSVYTSMATEDLHSITKRLIDNFNTQNQILKEALKQNSKPRPNYNKFVESIMQADSALKYLELFKNQDMIKNAIDFIHFYTFRQLEFSQNLCILIQLIQQQDRVLDIKQYSQQQQQQQSLSQSQFQSIPVSQSQSQSQSLSQHNYLYNGIPEFALNSLQLFNQQRSDFKEVLGKYENDQRIKQLIIQFKVKKHYKLNTDKRGLWYFMNAGDGHLYKKLNNFNEDYESFLELLQKERYQINSYEDRLRRRMFLKVFAKHKKNYESISFHRTSAQILIEQISVKSQRQSRQSIDIKENCDSVKLYIQAELITQRGFYKGKIRITSEYFMFENFGQSQISEDTVYKFQKDSLLKDEKQKLIPLSSIREVFPRGYLLQQTAIELFTVQNKTYLFNVFQNQQVIMKVLQQFQHIKIMVNPSECFKKGNYTERWRKGEMSNFQYLMEINKYGGRTYNDLNQYPIFPWVVSNYEDFDPNKEEHYRKLELPIGAINQKRLEQFLERFKQSDPNDSNTYFIYGTHYSHSAIILSFLMRMEPFASLHQELQSGKFDRPDRLFHSLEQQWYSVMNSSSDVKELIPEFYYFPEFLKNRNKFDLGQLQSGTVVSDVSLPKYVTTNTAEQMIFINELALESEYVSNNLQNWIDLIFGYKSGTNQIAVKNNNLFHKLTYAHCIQQEMLTAEDDIQREQFITQVYYYGQTPLQLFKKEHQSKSNNKLIENPLLQLNQMYQVVKLDKQIIKILINDKYLIIVFADGDLLSYSIESKLLRSKDLQNQEPKLISLNLGDNLRNKFVINDEFLVVGGYSDYTVKLYTLKELKLVCSVLFHNKIITSLSQSKNLLLCGSMDTRISAWEWTNEGLKHSPKMILYGHKSEISCLAVNEIIEIVVSMDLDNSVLIHSLQGVFLKLLQFQSDSTDLIIHPMGYIIQFKNKNLEIYTLNGDKYVEVEFNEIIIAIEVISQYYPEIIISTQEGNIFISSIIQLRLNNDASKSMRRKYKLEEMDIRSGEIIKKFQKPDQLSCFNFIKQQNNRIILLGYTNGLVVQVSECPKQLI